ncbi:hypothetical protein ABPG72_011353 [Tetrahymena utriculariae]
MSEVKGQAPVMHQKDLIIEKCEEIKQVDQIEDEYLGKLILYRLHPYVKYVASKAIPTQFIQNFAQRLQIRHPNIFFYIKKSHQNQKTNQQMFNVFFEYNFTSLEQMIQKRRDNGWHYPETELWTLIKEVASGMNFLMEQKIHHGELNKASIFFDDEYLLYRIYDNQLLNADKYYQYQKNNQNLLVDTGTLPPEFNSYELIQFKNHYKLDVWNFALIILECATLQNVKEFIYSNNTLKTDQLQILIQQINGKYSVSFINILLKMLDHDPRTRLDWAQIIRTVQNEPLAKSAPPYQVEPTQLHPSRCLNNLHEIVVGAQPQSSSQKENLNQDQQQGGMKRASPQKYAISDLQIYNTQNQQKINLQSNVLNINNNKNIQNDQNGFQQSHFSANNVDYENTMSKLDALQFKQQFSAQQLPSSNLKPQLPKKNSLQFSSQSNQINEPERDKSIQQADQNIELDQNIDIKLNLQKSVGIKVKESESDQKLESTQKSANSNASTTGLSVSQRLIELSKKIQETLKQSQKQTKKLAQNGPR